MAVRALIMGSCSIETKRLNNVGCITLDETGCLY